MKKKLGRTFAEATAEYEKEHGNLDGYHRDLDEVLADKSIHDAFNAVMASDPKMEREFWEKALKDNLDLFGESEWTRRIQESLDTGKFHLSRYIDERYLVRASTNKVHYDVPSIEKARTVAKDEAEVFPGKLVEIYELVEVATVPVNPVAYTKVKK